LHGEKTHLFILGSSPSEEGIFMNRSWLGTIGAGVAIAFLAIPLSVQGATKSELMQKANVPKAAAKDPAAKQQQKALQAKKLALVKERQALAKQGDMAALEDNNAKLDAVHDELNALKKGGAKQ
jgi:hypothetical protein